MIQDIAQRPNRIPSPPILVVLAVLVALALDAAWPVSGLLAGAGTWLRVAGIAIACIGLGFDLSTMLTTHRARCGASKPVTCPDA